MLTQYVFIYLKKYLVVIKIDYLLPMMLGRLNARTRFRAMAEASIPLSSISVDETSLSQSVDGELQARKCSFYLFFWHF